MRPARHAEAAEPAKLLLHRDARDFAQAQAVEVCRSLHAQQTDCARLAKDSLHQPIRLVLQCIEVREHLLLHELLRRLTHQPLFRRKLLRREHRRRVRLGKQKVSADEMTGKRF